MHRLPQRVRRALLRNEVTTAQQVIALYPQQLLNLPGVGIYCLRQIEQVFFPGQQYEIPRGFGYRPKAATASITAAPSPANTTVIRQGKVVRSRRSGAAQRS